MYGKSAWHLLSTLTLRGSNPTLSAIFYALKARSEMKTDETNRIRCMADMYGRRAGAKKPGGKAV
jgi:hypothetical protein